MAKTIKHNNQLDKQTINNLKQTINNLKTNLAIYENDMVRAEVELKEKFNVDSIEAATQAAENLTQEIDLLKIERSNIIEKVKIAMQEYNEEKEISD